MKLCIIDGCGKKVHARSLCSGHYRKLRLYGDPHVTKQYNDPEEAFAARTEWRGDCLIWTGEVVGKGYGRLHVNGGRELAHRYAWERTNGPIPEGMVVDHKDHCNTLCCNVDHLRVATYSENNSHRSRASHNSSTGIRNVHRYEDKLRVNIMKDGKSNYFGVFELDEIDKAAEAAEQGRKALFGNYAGKG